MAVSWFITSDKTIVEDQSYAIEEDKLHPLILEGKKEHSRCVCYKLHIDSSESQMN